MTQRTTIMPHPTLRNIHNVIAFLRQHPDDSHIIIPSTFEHPPGGSLRLSNQEVADFLCAIHDAYVSGPNKKGGDNDHATNHHRM